MKLGAMVFSPFEIHEDTTQEENLKLLVVTVEQIDDMFYLYNPVGDFLAQGKTKKEIQEALHDNLGDLDFIIRIVDNDNPANQNFLTLYNEW